MSRRYDSIVYIAKHKQSGMYYIGGRPMLSHVIDPTQAEEFGSVKDLVECLGQKSEEHDVLKVYKRTVLSGPVDISGQIAESSFMWEVTRQLTEMENKIKQQYITAVFDADGISEEKCKETLKMLKMEKSKIAETGKLWEITQKAVQPKL